ncbi:Williams-Beuren syndrome chromosomal region 16 protein-like protein [Smittium culicis]|uniref:Williams-Beuren syndrome chromosomal region 16 protein-like protein n=1 Tax=Smittium culicis TaxID=133412 RepID=A0A1R1YAW8_9FUNG|nr:Williams-Beuren syndrome chromosomal region 16 protein-like protein [Smittium culicis]
MFGRIETDAFELSAIGNGAGHVILSRYDRIKDVSEIFGFGLNRSYQLGYKSGDITQIKYKINGKVEQISCGREHSLILATESQILYACGNNSYGQLGVLNPGIKTGKSDDDFRLGSKHELVEVKSVELAIAKTDSIRQIKCGLDHSVILTDSGKVFCFGWNNDGQLGNSKFENSSMFSATNEIGGLDSEKDCSSISDLSLIASVAGLNGKLIERIDTSTDFTFALSGRGLARGNDTIINNTAIDDSNGSELFCWGNAEYKNNMANLDADRILEPVKVNFNYGKIVSFAAGGAHSVVATEDGHVYTAGFGAIGLGSENEPLKSANTPTRIENLKDIVSVYSSTDYCLAKDKFGKFFAWGLNNSYGVLGTGTSGHSYTPTEIKTGHLNLHPESQVYLGNKCVLIY